MGFILTFGSTHKALKGELVLRDTDVPFKLMPAPKALAEYCALVISVDGDSLDDALDALERAGSRPKAVYKKENDDYVEV